MPVNEEGNPSSHGPTYAPPAPCQSPNGVVMPGFEKGLREAPASTTFRLPGGEMAEWFKAHAWRA